MGYIKFDKDQLINLEYSLNKEMVRSNRAGSFSCTTILGCNTRKYHGLLITPQPELDGGHHVLLSKVDETIIQREAAFNIGVNKFPGTYNPKGHKYVRDFTADVIPVVTYRVGGVILTKETMFVTQQERILIRYTLVDAHSPTKLRFRPFLAFRNIHMLSKKNIDLNTRYEAVSNGIKVCMYDGYSDLFIQLSKKGGEYIHVPDWFNDFEYVEEKQRGYEYHEDLYTPGFFEIDIKKGESIIFSASTREISPLLLSRLFTNELEKRTPRDTFENCLKNSAAQFFYKYQSNTGIVAGYPWYGRIGRYTFLALPGLASVVEDTKLIEDVFKTMIDEMRNDAFPEVSVWKETSYASADTALWFFWAIQKSLQKKTRQSIWKQYGGVMSSILDAYASGTHPYMSMQANYLIQIEAYAPAITWMNAIIYDEAVTPRHGYVVEVNALWYNAVSYALELARSAKDKNFIAKWEQVPELIQASFNQEFWNPELGYLADYVSNDKQEMSIRPNQVIATSLPYTPLKENQRKSVLDIITKYLVTPRGLRTLSPNDAKYMGHYEGDVVSRDMALHQGTVWPWLLGHYAEAFLSIHGQGGISFIENLYNGFKSTMKEHGVGSISEIFDGNPPHLPKGSISFAPSVAELARIQAMLQAQNE